MANAHGLVTTMVAMMVSVVMVTMVMPHGNCPWPMAHGPWPMVHGDGDGGVSWSHGKCSWW